MPSTPILPAPTDSNVREWLTTQMKESGLTYLLAFADDGVIWGRMDDDTLVIAHEASQKVDKQNFAELRDKTLQEAHLFGKDAEVRLFHDELGDWKALKIEDEGEVITESQILWGDKLGDKDQPLNEKFTKLLADRKGIPAQILPVKREEYATGKLIRLEVRHLVDFNEDGEAYITLSRLAGLSVEEKEKDVVK